MEYKEIRDFVEQVKPELDAPGVYVPMLNQYLTDDIQWFGKSDEPPTRVCYVMSVPEDAAIQNIGIGILLKIVNEEMGPDFIGSVHYYPETKMLKRMKKASVPLFDNWLFHPLSEFDILGFSAYFSLQYLNMISMLDLIGIPSEFESRMDSWDYPVVVLGGVQAYSAECISPLFDAYLIGEGEEMNSKFFELYRKRKADGTSKKDFLYEAAREIQGVYLPWAYEFEYYSENDPKHPNQIKSYDLTPEAKQKGVPKVVLKAAIEFRDREPLTKMLVSNTTAMSMTTGSLFCANSCSNMCSFCHGSHLTLPYREIPFDVAKNSAKELVKNTGSQTVTPYSFNVSDLSYANRFTADMLTELNTRVTLSSERLDTINDDFVKATVKSGSRAFTVAIEAASPRMRHIFNKNLTEEQILNAFDVMIKNGASKIKIYNISMGPFETMEDLEYYAVLLKKINAIKKKYKAKVAILLAFTPFNPKPHTMLQWSMQNNIALDENKNPVMLKPHIAVIPKIYEAMDNNIQIKFETPSLVQLVAYCLNYADRRVYSVIKAMSTDPDVNYIGGMGIGAKGAEAFIKHLRNLTSLDLDYFQREHDPDEVFPWEPISNGMDKSWLYMLYEKAKKAAGTPVDQEGFLRKPCYVACTYCGVCRSLDKTRGNNGDSRNSDGSINESYWDPEIYGKNRYLPVFEYGDNSLDHDVTISDKIDAFLKPKRVQVLRLQVTINPLYRYVDTQKFKYRVRKAFYKSGISILPDVQATSDKILTKAYFSGKEIYEVSVPERHFNFSMVEIKTRLNENLDDSMSVDIVENYTGKVKRLNTNFDFVLYSITVPTKLYPVDKVEKAVDKFNSVQYFPVKVPQRNSSSFGTIKLTTINAKSNTKQCFYKDNKDSTVTVFAELSGNLAMYDFIGALLGVNKRNFYRYPAIVEEYLLKSSTGLTFDMFSNSCSVCGNEIETNIFGEPVSDCYCLKHKYLSDFNHTFVDQTENSEYFNLESDELQTIDLSCEMKDTDLEAYVVSKNGSNNV